MTERRFDKYPQMSRLVRLMGVGQRDAVAHWHRVLTTALEGYLPHAKQEVKMAWGNRQFQRIAKEGATIALDSWLLTMREVSALIVDPGAADWCCAPGMMAAPDPCPQHGYDPSEKYEIGTIIERVAKAQDGFALGRERAVCVQAFGSGEGEVEWVSLERGKFLSPNDLWPNDGWVVVGRA